MLPTVDSIEDCEKAIRNWLQMLSGGMLAIQATDNPDIKTRHFQFQLIGIGDPGNVENCHVEKGDGTIQLCSVSRMALTYQLDAMYCSDAAQSIARVVNYFHSGAYRTHGSFENLAFTQASDMRRVPEWITGKRHFKATADLEFIYAEKQCLDSHAIESVVIAPCPEAPAMPTVTVTKP